MIVCDHKVALEKFKVIWLRLLSLIDFYLTVQGSLFMKRDKPTSPVCKNVLSQEVFCLRVTTWEIDSTSLPFCVVCLNIILKKHQTDLTITLIGNCVNGKAAFSNSLHCKIYEHVREVVTIHKNNNHKKHFPELHFSISNIFSLPAYNLKFILKILYTLKWLFPKNESHFITNLFQS